MKILLLTVLFGLGSSLTTDNCPAQVQRDEYLKVFGDNCFRFYTVKDLDFLDARAVCTGQGGTLVMPKTKEINAFVSTQLYDTYGVTEDTWIGLNDNVEENKFLWEDNSPLAWQAFGEGEGPRTGFFFPDWEDCVAMTPKDGLWHDYHCDSHFWGILDTRKPFVCQYPVVSDLTIAPTTTACPEIQCTLNCGMFGLKKDSVTGCLKCECDV